MGQLGEAFSAIDPDLLARAQSDVAPHVVAVAQGDWNKADVPMLQAKIENNVPVLGLALEEIRDRIDMAHLLPDSEENRLLIDELSGIYRGFLLASTFLGRCVELEEIQEGLQR